MCAVTVTKEKGRRHSLGMTSIDLDPILVLLRAPQKQTATCAASQCWPTLGRLQQPGCNDGINQRQPSPANQRSDSATAIQHGPFIPSREVII